MATKYLLIEDVEALGRSGDFVSVRPGYARNFLLPKGLAVFADKNALRIQARLMEEREKRAEQEKKGAEEIAKRMEELTITITVKIDPEAHMYGSVTIVDIVKLLKEQADIKVEKRSILLKHPIKEIGVHTIDVKLQDVIPASFTLKITPEE